MKWSYLILVILAAIGILYVANEDVILALTYINSCIALYLLFSKKR